MSKRYDCVKRAKHLFTADEDQQIIRLVQTHGLKAWKLIASQIQDRTARQCRERWRNYLSPDVHNAPWTESEDSSLLELESKLGTQWAKIAGHFEHRTDTNVKNRWILLQRKMKRPKKSLRKQKKMIKPLQGYPPNCDLIKPSSENTRTDVTPNNIINFRQCEDDKDEEQTGNPMIDFWDRKTWGALEDPYFASTILYNL